MLHDIKIKTPEQRQAEELSRLISQLEREHRLRSDAVETLVQMAENGHSAEDLRGHAEKVAEQRDKEAQKLREQRGEVPVPTNFSTTLGVQDVDWGPGEPPKPKRPLVRNNV